MNTFISYPEPKLMQRYNIFSKHPKDGITDIIMKRHYFFYSIYYISTTYTAFYI